MKVALHTVDLFPGRERLMPFRTVLEVAKVMRENGWEADVINSSVSEKKVADFAWETVPVVQCPRDFSLLSKWVNERGYDAFYFACTIREGLKNLCGFQLVLVNTLTPIGSIHAQNGCLPEIIAPGNTINIVGR